MKAPFVGTIAFLVALMLTPAAWAQGGGASATGTIQGRVVDAQGAVLPGVTVTATSPALLGQQTAVTSETGNYRFPAVPPGTYTVDLRARGLQHGEARRHLDHARASRPTSTSSSRSPRCRRRSRSPANRRSSTRRRRASSAELQARTAAVDPERPRHVGAAGGHAGGADGPHRRRRQPRRHADRLHRRTASPARSACSLKASTRRKAPAAPASTSTTRRSKKCSSARRASRPRCRTRRAEPVHREVGRQPVRRRVLPRLVQQRAAGIEHPRRVHVPTAFNSSPIREHSNEIDSYYDTAINVGGPIKRDKLWWFGTYREQQNAVAQPNFQFDKTFDTKLWNPVGKATYQVNQNNKLIGYYQWGQKMQPNRAAVRHLHLQLAGADLHAGLGQLGLQGRMERHDQRQAVSRSALR